MSDDRRHELNEHALDPSGSVVIEACAGSGKTWLLVSRIVRLLLAGAQPSQILAITFTRKAAQEMATRLRDWLRELATGTDDEAREFLRQREVPAGEIDALLPKARQLYEQYLTAQPPVTIATFHSWFLQLLRRAPLDAGALGDVNLVEQTSALVEEAWENFARRLQRNRDTPAARGLDWLFGEAGLDNTRRLLTQFLHRRADWRAYTLGQADPVGYALGRLREDMEVAPDADVIGDLLADAAFVAGVRDYAALLERNTDGDRKLAQRLDAAGSDAAQRFEAICGMVLTDKGTPRARKANGAQANRLGAGGEARLLELHDGLGARLLEARARLADQASYRFNEAALACGVALLEAYQGVKAERQVIDYADIECHAWELTSVSEHAVYMHYKLDARYRHVLLDEFQDTNPLQWLTLKSWLEAAAAADLRPTVFMVGDPKQSIYRFRRAEARLFDGAARYLLDEFGARRLSQDESRRCPPPVIAAVNGVFGAEAAYAGFVPHAAHYAAKPGRVEVLPLVAGREAGEEEAAGSLALRNPLEREREDAEDRRRADEADLLVARLRAIHGHWRVATDAAGGETRPADWRDVMILVRRRRHLEVYERALRHAGIPFVTSRHGGLLETLEARDMVALLEFLVSPFADLQLAHALRSPVFGCSDEDLIAIAAAREGEGGGTWWERLQRVAAASPALARAKELLARWLERAGSLPVHDQLDRIYFESDMLARYRQAVPEAMQGAVLANLQAFMQRALDTDSGRYPSLPRFLHELTDLREAPPEEAPDEGIVGDAGNAVRIYTVHGAKGLEAPIVWLLGAGAGQDAGRGYETQVDWPPDADAPRALSVWPRKDAQSAAQRRIAEEEARLAERENLNLLYVAMTRAQQALIVSGTEGRGQQGSWHERVRAAMLALPGAVQRDGAVVLGDELAGAKPARGRGRGGVKGAPAPDPRLNLPLPTGERREAITGPGLAYGTQFHALMERLTARDPADRAALQRALGLSDREFAPMWEQAMRVIAAPALRRFFDATQFRRAVNEASYVAGDGEVRRIDRLVERDDAVWVLDYKTGEAKAAGSGLLEQYRTQVAEYRTAVGQLYPGRAVRGAIIFADATLMEI